MRPAIRVLYAKDLMEILGIGRDRAYTLMRSADFPSTKFGHTYFVTEENFNSWLNKNAGKTYKL